MFENFNLKRAAGAAEQHCEALLHEISTGAKNVLDYANHHRPQTSLTAAGLAAGGLFIVSRGRVKAGAVEELAGEVEALTAKSMPAAAEKAAAGAVGPQTERALLSGGAAASSHGAGLAHEIATLENGARINHSSLRLVEGTGSGKSWQQIFHDSFPPEQRDPTHAVINRIQHDGSILYETKGQLATAGRALRDRTAAISIVEPIGEGTLAGASKQYKLLSWHATRDGFRSEGLGGKQLDQILQRTRETNDTAAIAVEIEHTGLRRLPDATKIREMIRTGKIDRDLVDPAIKINPEEQQNALRRAAYYLEHGAKVADVKYALPNLSDSSKAASPAHLLYFNGTDKALTNTHVRTMVKNVLVNGYELDKSHEFVKQMLSTVGKAGKSGL